MALTSAYPKEILQEYTNGGYFSFTPPVCLLLSLISDVDIDTISKCKILSRSLTQYIPWYKARKGGGAITLGSAKWIRIYFTENFFSDDSDLYGRGAYGTNLSVWLRLASHEVVHIAHAKRFSFILIYLLVFIYQYIVYGHDLAPLEKEADQGTSNYDDFNRYFYKSEGQSVPDFLKLNIDDEMKNDVINKCWQAFKGTSVNSLHF